MDEKSRLVRFEPDTPNPCIPDAPDEGYEKEYRMADELIAAIVKKVSSERRQEEFRRYEEADLDREARREKLEGEVGDIREEEDLVTELQTFTPRPPEREDHVLQTVVETEKEKEGVEGFDDVQREETCSEPSIESVQANLHTRQKWREYRRIQRRQLLDRLNSQVSDTPSQRVNRCSSSCRSPSSHICTGSPRTSTGEFQEENGSGDMVKKKGKGETIVNVSVVGYDMTRKLYSVKLELAPPSTSPLLYVLSWETEVRDVFKHLRKSTPDSNYCSLLLAIDREFNFRPWFKNFHQFRKGVPGRHNHRSPQHVESVLRFLFWHAGTTTSAHHDCANLFVISLFRIFERGHLRLSPHFVQWKR